MNYFCEKPTSRVLRPPGGGSSNIFGDADDNVDKKTPKPTYQSSVFASNTEPEKPKSVAAPRRDPITGAMIGEVKEVQKTNVSGENGEKDKSKANLENKPLTSENPSPADLDPLPGAPRGRCAHPPGGKSSISFS